MLIYNKHHHIGCLYHNQIHHNHIHQHNLKENKQRIKMGSKEVKIGNRFLSIIKSIFGRLSLVVDKDRSAKDSEAAYMGRGPEATMVAAAAHFSSAHKVRLI
ncbi:hypothetical protein HanRHA438_Chr17g0839081 [Helianthus annuus]|nr:hypothetical protein HanRHA438_Chr17g0839081 [Helianthus annuus]